MYTYGGGQKRRKKRVRWTQFELEYSTDHAVRLQSVRSSEGFKVESG